MAKRRKMPPYAGNKNALRDINLKEMPKPFFLPPSEVSSKYIDCSCGNRYFPKWLDILDHEHYPVQSADGRVWAPSAIGIACPACGVENMFHFPASSNNGEVTFFGDESSQLLTGDRFVYIYAFVELSSERKEIVSKILENIKVRIRPGVDPDSWSMHVFEVGSIEWRKKNNINLSLIEIDECFRELAR